MPVDEIINIRGIDVLDEKQKQLVNRLLNEYYLRILRMIKNLTVFEAHIKAYEAVEPSKGKEGHVEKSRKKGILLKKGKDKEFSFSIRIVSPAAVFKADYADWDLARVIHKVMNKMINEIEHKLHSEDQHEKIRRPQNVRKRK